MVNKSLTALLFNPEMLPMKIFNFVIAAILGLCAIEFVWCIVNMPGTKPDDILSAVDLKISNYSVENESIGGYGSSYTSYIYNITFSSNDSEKLLNKLASGYWVRDGLNQYTKSVDIDGALTYSDIIQPKLVYSASVDPKSGTATLEATIDEEYEIQGTMHALIVVFIVFLCLGLWAIVKLSRVIIDRNRRKNRLGLKTPPMKIKNILFIIGAVVIALVMPFFIMQVIYPAFKIFLPEGNNILTPSLRIMATVIMGIIDYGIAYIPIYYSNKGKSRCFNLVCFVLTLIWCAVVGVLWYIAL